MNIRDWASKLFRRPFNHKEEAMSEGKMKYDILRNSLRTMLAEGRFGPKNAVQIKALLESVREKDEDTLASMVTASEEKREAIRKVTGSNGDPVRAAA